HSCHTACLAAAEELSPISNLGVGSIKHNIFRGGKSTLEISSIRSVAGNSKGDDGAGNGSGGDGTGNDGEGIWGSRDDSGDNRDGGSDDKGSASATAAMSASVAAAIYV
ncbi:hypothetical protein Tco_0518354, partial [Tanacetum coccineum]